MDGSFIVTGTTLVLRDLFCINRKTTSTVMMDPRSTKATPTPTTADSPTTNSVTRKYDLLQY